MQIVDVPIEAFEERYSAQWQDWFQREYRKAGVSYLRVAPGTTLTQGIQSGSFLDVHGTNWYKARQLQELTALLYHGVIKDGDWIFLHDLWFPGIEMLAYIRDASGVKFKIAGCLHAGTWDWQDFLVRKGMQRWAAPFELSMFEIADVVFVATLFHEELLVKRFGHSLVDQKVHITGFPIYPGDFLFGRSPPGISSSTTVPERATDKLVVFPHRLDAEKCPEMFDELARDLDLRDAGLRFLRTRDVCHTKTAYYKLLQEATYAVSFAKQETWGIAMQEAAFAGCVPLVPARLSYPEMYVPPLCFASQEQLKNTLLSCAQDPKMLGTFRSFAETSAKHLRIMGEAAIPRMLKILQNRSET